MKTAVFSDIHGNFDALEKVMSMIEKESPDKVIFLGDIFQKGNGEIECLDYLMNSDIITVKGNAELYIEHGVDIDPDVEYLREYYESMWNKLSNEQKNFIHNLPLTHVENIDGYRILFSHFLIRNINAAYPYFNISDMKKECFSEAVKSHDFDEYDMVAVGHTHTDFETGKLRGVSSTGIVKPEFMLIETGKELTCRYITE
ncbi:MAG: metallophosphoesterase [Clostridia bacterium]|nr:metallophosphoesterase [Clostridia bacterium]